MKQGVESLREALRKRSSVILAYLFGSKVKGYADTRSDWDVAVYFGGHKERRPRWPGFELEAELSKAVGGEVQVTILNDPLTPVFGFEIVKDGIVLLDRDKNLRMDFVNRILRQYYDWQYFLRRQMQAEKASAGPKQIDDL